MLSPFGEVRESVTPRARPTRAQARSTVVDPILSGFAGRPGEPVSGQLSSPRDGRVAGRAPRAGAPGAPNTPRARAGPPGNRSPAGHHGDDRERLRLSRRKRTARLDPPAPGDRAFVRVLACTARRAGVRTSKADAVRQRSTPAQRPIAICSTGVARSGAHRQEITRPARNCGAKPEEGRTARGSNLRVRRGRRAWPRTAGPC